MMTNRDRADRVRSILEEQYEAEDLATSLRDLLADARHFADAEWISFLEQDCIARDHYCAEVFEETEGH